MTAAEFNKQSYDKRAVVGFYKKMAVRGLTPCEIACLERVPAARRGAVLDIGIGAGRTTAALAGMFQTYIGIDYSDNMVAAAKQRFPGFDLRTMDARDLRFDTKFDCVMFSFNGIDALDIDGRKRAMQNVAAVLEPGGYFVYSMHNFANPRRAAWMENFFVRELFEWRSLAKPWRLCASLRNRRKNFSRQSFAEMPGAAYVNDPGENFAMMITYIDLETERALLRRCGLIDTFMIGNRTQRQGYTDHDDWIYILAQKMESARQG